MVIVTELLLGGTLRKYLLNMRPRCLDTRVAVGFALDIARAMECLHSHGIIHRDLKPGTIVVSLLNSANILVLSCGKVKNLYWAAHDECCFSIFEPGKFVGFVCFLHFELAIYAFIISILCLMDESFHFFPFFLISVMWLPKKSSSTFTTHLLAYLFFSGREKIDKELMHHYAQKCFSVHWYVHCGLTKMSCRAHFRRN